MFSVLFVEKFVSSQSNSRVTTARKSGNILSTCLKAFFLRHWSGCETSDGNRKIGDMNSILKLRGKIRTAKLSISFYSLCLANRVSSAAGYIFRLTFGRYPTSRTLTSVGRKESFQVRGKNSAAFSCCGKSPVVPPDYSPITKSHDCAVGILEMVD